MVSSQKPEGDAYQKIPPLRSKISPFRADLTEMEAEEPYTVMWKVLNVGDEARRRNMIRGQIVSDGGYCTKKETTDFRGDHMVECYVIKNEVVVARAQIEVPIS